MISLFFSFREFLPVKLLLLLIYLIYQYLEKFEAFIHYDTDFD